MVVVDCGTLHVRDNTSAAAERQHRQPGEQRKQLKRDQHHLGRVSQAGSRLTGSITTSTCISEKPATPIGSVTGGGDGDR